MFLARYFYLFIYLLNHSVCICVSVCACVLMPQVISAVHGVYQSLLSLKNIPTLEAAYKMVLGEMACALSSLTVTLTPSGRAPAPGGPCPSIQHPAFASLNLPLEKAQFIIIFNLSTLTTIGNTKNSLIGVRPKTLNLSDLGFLLIKNSTASSTTV